ncbi:hypothetical protein B9Z19DRAFT_1119874 [Tuber borchii]|uniref:Uncharacterized protein n=1 Tax=Tuber borchii TaxID=42251 RepID=A0A2T7A5R7_TUBBO|nr:hypothetical protein B9Z19DRAFT_1119874 [Tuber borchii]
MAANMFRFLIRPQEIARVQAIGYLQRQPTHRRLFSADSKPEKEDRGGEEGSTLKKRLWDRVFENDKPLADLRKELKDHEIAIHKAIKDHEIATNNAIKDRETTANKAISNLSARVGTGFAEVRTQFAEVRTDSAEVRTDFAQLKRKISFMQWQIGLVGSAVVAFLGFAGYAIKRAMDAQVVTSVGSEPATESKDVSNGVRKK